MQTTLKLGLGAPTRIYLSPIPLMAVAVSLSICTFAFSQDWVWETPNPYPMQSAAQMAFLDSQTGYMAGLGDTPLVTHDGGRSWAPADLPNEQHRCVFALDDQHAWMFGNYGARTTDGGQTWQDLGFHTAWEVRFLDPRFGWTSDGYVAMVTHDGGLSWTQATSGTTRIIYPDFRDNQIGIGRQANFGSAIWRTSDGGQSWAKVLDADITNVRFVTDTVAVAVGGGRIYRSADAGQTWSDVGAGLSPYPQIIVFDDSRVIVNVQNAYKRSADGGQTWTAMAAPAGNLYKILIRGGQDAYGLTGEGGILHSTDAFLTWESVYAPTHIALSDIVFLPDGAVVAAGTDYILHSEDGLDWDVVSSGVKGTVVGVEMFDAQRGLAIANGGYVLRTTDGGNQWVASLPSYLQGYGWNYCKDIFILDDQIAYVAGADGPGPMIKTTDGGATWQPMSYPTTTQIESVWFVDEQHG